MYILILLIFIILLYVIVQYNIFVNLIKKVERSKSGIDIYLTQRFDLIPNLVECVKQYSIHEQDILDSVTANRTKYMETKSLKDVLFLIISVILFYF